MKSYKQNKKQKMKKFMIMKNKCKNIKKMKKICNNKLKN